MKILLAISKFLPEYSGPAFRIFNTYERLKKINKIDLDIFCQNEENNKYSEYIYEGYNVTRFKSYNLIFFKKIINQIIFFYFFFKLLKISKDYDIFHVVGSSQITTAALYVSRIKGIPLFYELVNASATPIQKNKILNILYKIDLKNNSVISCLSNLLKEKCKKVGLKDNIWTRPNPVDHELFKFARTKNTKEYLLYISQFIPRKNQIFLIDVMNHLPKSYNLVIAGPISRTGINSSRDLKYLKKIKLKIKQYKLEKNITIITDFIDTKKYLKNASIYLIPSYNEGLGTTLIESLALGVPVIANTNESVFSEYILDNFNGALLDLDSIKWAGKIKKIYNNPKYNSSRISDDILKKASSEVIDKQMINIFNLLKNNKHNKSINIKGLL